MDPELVSTWALALSETATIKVENGYSTTNINVSLYYILHLRLNACKEEHEEIGGKMRTSVRNISKEVCLLETETFEFPPRMGLPARRY